MTSHESNTPSPREMLDALQVARDRARVQAHLLSLDAKRRWQELETNLLGLQSKLELEGHEVAANVATKFRDVTQTAKDLLRELDGRLELATPVRKIMSRDLKTCSPEDSLERAAQVMWDFDCGVVFVVDPRGTVVGTVTDRDVCMGAYTRGRPLSDVSVGDTMNRLVHACTPDDSIGDAIRLMADKQVRRLPVLDAGEFVGVVSLADIVREVSHYQGNSIPACEAIAHALAEICDRRDGARNVGAAAE